MLHRATHLAAELGCSDWRLAHAAITVEIAITLKIPPIEYHELRPRFQSPAHPARAESLWRFPDQAEDLTQDAFLQVFRKLSTFRGNSALSTWLYRIAVNTVLMDFRKKVLRQISLDEPSNQDAKQVRREYGSQDGRLSASVDRITLTRAIKDLPAGYKQIFLMHEVEGYEHQEIAKLLNCSVGNSKSQLYKAKLRIREFLGEKRNARPCCQCPEFSLD